MLDKIVKVMKKTGILITAIRQKKLFCFIFLFVILSGSLYSQPKGKLQAIIYPNDVVGVGYVDKKQFVENQEVTFLNLSGQSYAYYIVEKDRTFYLRNRYGNKTDISVSSLDTIVSGIYFKKNGIAYIEGTLHPTVFTNKKTVYGGIFHISNTDNDDKSLTTNPNKALKTKLTQYQYTNKLKIGEVDIHSYQGYYQRNYKGLYDQEEYPITLQKQSDCYVLKIKYDDRLLDAPVSFDNVNKHGIFAFDALIESTPNVKLNYANGNIFVGFVEKNKDKYIAKKGEYRYTTGEIYTGIVENKNLGGNYFIVHDQGKTVFADGTTADGNWTKEYNFTDNEWKQIFAESKSLTDVRNLAINMNKKKGNDEKLRIEAAEKEFYAKYPSAKSNPKPTLTQNGSSAMDDLFPQVSNIKVGMSYQELKTTLPLELYDKSLTTIQGNQAIRLTPNNRKIQEFLIDALKLKPEAEAKEIAQSLLIVEMALQMAGKSWADSFPKITLLNDKVYSVFVSE